jgi:hypothetical protein
MWHHVKASLPIANRSKHHLLGYLSTFMLKRKWRNEKDGFDRFMKTAAAMHKTGYNPSDTNGQSTKERHEILREEISSTVSTTARKKKQPSKK